MGQNDIWKIVGLIGHFWMASAKMVIGLKRRARFALFMKIKTPPMLAFEESHNGLVARFSGNSEKVDLNEAQDTNQEMICLGPDLGG